MDMTKLDTLEVATFTVSVVSVSPIQQVEGYGEVKLLELSCGHREHGLKTWDWRVGDQVRCDTCRLLANSL